MTALPSASIDTWAPPSRDVLDGFRNILFFAGIQSHGRTESFGQSQSAVIDVHTNHLCAHGAGDHDSRQPHTAAPVNGHPLARQNTALRHNGSEGGHKPASKNRRGHKVDFLRKSHEIDIRSLDRHVLGKSSPVRESGLKLMITNLMVA